MGAAVKVSRLLVNDIDCNFWTLAYFCIAVIVSDLAADLAVLRLASETKFCMVYLVRNGTRFQWPYIYLQRQEARAVEK